MSLIGYTAVSAVSLVSPSLSHLPQVLDRESSGSKTRIISENLSPCLLVKHGDCCFNKFVFT